MRKKTQPNLPAKGDKKQQHEACRQVLCNLRVLIMDKCCETFVRVSADYTSAVGNGVVRL